MENYICNVALVQEILLWLCITLLKHAHKTSSNDFIEFNIIIAFHVINCAFPVVAFHLCHKWKSSVKIKHRWMLRKKTCSMQAAVNSNCWQHFRLLDCQICVIVPNTINSLNSSFVCSSTYSFSFWQFFSLSFNYTFII